VPAPSSESTLQLLLFVDERPSTRDLVEELEEFIEADPESGANLQIVDVSDRPYLAEHFKVVMTPTLLRITPLPRQVISGKNLLSKLKTFWDDWRIQAKINFSGGSREHSGLADSITYSAELIQLADRLFQMKRDKEELEEQLHFKDRIVAMLAHDLRNPLTALSLALETIEVGGEKITPKLMEQLLHHARNQTKIVNAMITDLLEAGRGSNTEFKLNLRRIELDKLCYSVINDLYFIDRLKAKEQDLVVDIPSGLPLVFADEERIRQVLTNLLSNAVKYTPVAGKIVFTVLDRTSQKTEVSITDTGPGIPPELRDRIFEERYRIERDDNEDGYGIGLSLCRRIVRAHYGQIWVEDAGKQGSCFRFTLPVY
jgi:two-component system clock-associated histidine kinase SasA